MDWQKVSSRHWQRPIGENEAFIRFIGSTGAAHGKDTWSIFTVGHFNAAGLELDAATLQQTFCEAWKRLRYVHPSIASTATDSTLDYHSPDPAELKEWASETFLVVEDDIDAENVIANLTPKPFATLYYLSQKSCVVLHLSHWRTDGIGALQLLDSYFAAAISAATDDTGKLVWGAEYCRLVPSVESALNLPHEASKEIEQNARKYIETLAHTVGALTTPYRGDAETSPAGTRSVQYRFTQEQTSKLEELCQGLGLSLTSAVHAAIAATNDAIAPVEQQQNRHHVATMRHSIRPHLPSPYNSTASAAGLYTGGFMLKLTTPQSFLENAKYCEAEYQRGATPEFLSSRREYAIIVKALLQKNPKPSVPPSGLDISSIGEAQKHVRLRHERAGKSLEVKSIAIGVETLSRHVYCFMWVFRGQLEFNVVYNEAFYEASVVESIVSTLRGTLEAGLSG